MVQYISLDIPSTQRLVKMLAVNVGQQLAESLQALQRDRIAVDEGARASVGPDDATQQAFVVHVQRLVLKPFEHRRVMTNVEFGAEFGPSSALSHEPATAALAENEAERIDEYRLAGAGLAGHHRHAGTEVEIDFVDDGKVANVKVEQHQGQSSLAPMSRSRLSRPQCSFDRRIP